MSIQHIDNTPAISEIVIHGDTVYLAGQVADDDSLDMAGQVAQVLNNIDRALERAGSARSKMLAVQVFIKNLEDFDTFNQAWTTWLAGSTPPTRATVQANMVNPNWLIEIVVTAAK